MSKEDIEQWAIYIGFGLLVYGIIRQGNAVAAAGSPTLPNRTVPQGAGPTPTVAAPPSNGTAPVAPTQVVDGINVIAGVDLPQHYPYNVPINQQNW